MIRENRRSGRRERFWRWLAARLKSWSKRAAARGDAYERARHYPRGTVVTVANPDDCRCGHGLRPRAEWVVLGWVLGEAEYALRPLSEDGVSLLPGLEYACDKIVLEPTGRTVAVLS